MQLYPELFDIDKNTFGLLFPYQKWTKKGQKGSFSGVLALFGRNSRTKNCHNFKLDSKIVN